MWHTTLWSCTHIPNKYYFKNNYLTLRSKSHEGHYGTWHTALNEGKHIVLVWFFFHFFCFFSAKLVRTITFLSFQIGQWYLVCECMTIRRCVAYCNDIRGTLFDLEVKVPWRSLWYVTHRLMVMHPHTKYHWPILRDTNVIRQRWATLYHRSIKY
jgi:hypothetical protein